MTFNRCVLLFGGAMTLLSVLLKTHVSPCFDWFPVFISANLIQSSVTGCCPAASAFCALGIKKGYAFE